MSIVKTETEVELEPVKEPVDKSIVPVTIDRTNVSKVSRAEFYDKIFELVSDSMVQAVFDPVVRYRSIQVGKPFPNVDLDLSLCPSTEQMIRTIADACQSDVEIENWPSNIFRISSIHKSGTM